MRSNTIHFFATKQLFYDWDSLTGGMQSFETRRPREIGGWSPEREENAPWVDFTAARDAGGWALVFVLQSGLYMSAVL